MKNSIIEPIRTYLEEEQTDYCVMITWKWGSGKSFYIKNCLQRDLLDGANKKLIYPIVWNKNNRRFILIRFNWHL